MNGLSDNPSAADNQQETIKTLSRFHPYLYEISDESDSTLCSSAFQLAERTVMYQICGLTRDEAATLFSIEKLLDRNAKISDRELQTLRVLRIKLRSSMAELVRKMDSSETTRDAP